jgi:hypothetical protein
MRLVALAARRAGLGLDELQRMRLSRFLHFLQILSGGG